MNFKLANVIRWAARILAIAFIIFVSVFALDAFSQSNWFVALLIHLIPSYFLIALTVVAWKNELLGGLLFITASLVFMAVSRFEAAIIYIPALVLGFLFLLSKWLKK
jgi:hypothetical protein